MNTKMCSVISDPGIDDLIALVLLHKLLPGVKNLLISTFGNAAEDITSVNAKEFISFVAESWNFMHGSKGPLNGMVERPWPDYFHGSDGVWGVHPPADIQNIHSNEKMKLKDECISLAPLTSIFQLLKTKEISEITLMGGAFEIEGNETRFAETNVAFDSDAAAYFFKEIENVKVNVVPLDVTRKVRWSKEQIDTIPETDKINIWLKQLLSTWFIKYNHEKEKDFNLHDPLAVFLHFFPEQAYWVTSGVQVMTKGKNRGQTVFCDHNPICHIAIDLQDEKKISQDIYSIIFSS